MNYVPNALTKLASFSLLLACLALATGPQDAKAQANFQLGPRGGIGVGDVSDLFIGADARFGVGALPVRLNPTFDYYFFGGDTDDLFAVTINGLYDFSFNNQLFTPYTGAGLSIARMTHEVGNDETELGLNLLFGVAFETSPNWQPFAQAQFTVGSEPDLFGIAGGVLFSL